MKLAPKQKRKAVRLRGREAMDKVDKPKLEKSGIEDKREKKVSKHTAEERCRAVLSIWTERRKPGEICRELGVTWNLLNQWQDLAMEGMLLALQPRVSMEKAVALNPRLAVLLERKSKGGTMKGLERRLVRLQGGPIKQGELRETVAEKKV